MELLNLKMESKGV